MRAMKNSGIPWIGEMPESWNLRRMKNCILSRTSGAWGEEAKGADGDVICLRIADFDYDRFVFKNTPVENLTIRNYDNETIKKLLLQKGDILIEKSGGGEKTPVGRTVVFERDYPALYANFMDRLRCACSVLSKWMQYVFVTFYKNDYTRNYIKQTTGIQNLDLTSMLANERVPIPSIDEQEKITGFLDTECARIYAVMEQTRASIEEYKKLKQAIITQAVTEGIRPGCQMKNSDNVWIGEIPSEWKTTKIKYISSGVGDGLHAAPEFEDNGLYYFINGNNLGDKQIRIKDNTNSVSEEEFSKYNQPALCSNAILIALNGTYGLVSFYNGEKVMLGKSAGYINLFPAINRNYVRYALLSDYSKRQMDDSLAGTTIANVSLRTIKNLSIAWPSEEEQEEISMYLDSKCLELDRLLKGKAQLINELESYKKSLIFEYVTGKKEV